MNWLKVFNSGGKGVVSVILGLLVSAIPQLQEWVTGLIPEEWATMTIAGVVAFAFNAIRNYLKHKDNK